MAIINLQTSDIKNISTEIDNLNNTIKSYLTELNDKVDEIADNVQNDTIHQIIGDIKTRSDEASAKLNNDLPKLNSFLQGQMDSYQKTEEAALERLQTVLKRMGEFAIKSTISEVGSTLGSAFNSIGNGVKDTVASGQAVNSSSNESSNKRKGYSDIFGEYVNDQFNVTKETASGIAKSWEFDKTKNATGIVTAVGGVAWDVGEGAVGTVGNMALGTGKNIINTAKTGFEFTGETLRTVGDAASWLGNHLI